LEFQLATISSVGGRTTAATLLRQQLISDVFLTTSSIAAGVPDTPLHLPTAGRRLVLAKAGRQQESGVRFEHWLI
jgi:hypothetical protein